MNKNDILSFISKVQLDNAGRSHLTKSINTRAEDFTSGDNGEISGYCATFEPPENPDKAGDIIRKGAFLGSLERRKKTGHPFPMCYNHDFSQVIGRVAEIREDAKGLFFRGIFFPTERAQEVRGFVKAGVLWRFSFAYDTLNAGKIKNSKGQTVNELRELELHEVSICLIPCNDNAIMTDIKNGLTPEQKSQQERLLKFINRIEMESRNNPKVQLKYYQGLKEQCLRDIGKADVEGKTEWKSARLNALKAIEREIKRIGILIEKG